MAYWFVKNMVFQMVNLKIRAWVYKFCRIAGPCKQRHKSVWSCNRYPAIPTISMMEGGFKK
ncbi:MAG: hypothetical protein COA43_07990 [Robiginitomaculum sp.]|nr:MAG: hypothetical protein COA43_07990 [Robiginitomaculum sp.]